MQPVATIHAPVLLTETIRYLKPVEGGIYVDGTLGLGGHAERILEECAPTGRLIGFEWDAAARELAAQRLARFGDRVRIIDKNFAELRPGLMEAEVELVDGIVLDLGVSSLQLNDNARGFSFRSGAQLDMRMDRRLPHTASDLVNRSTEKELADIFYYYGEERQARRIASRVAAERRRAPVTTCNRLAEIVSSAIPRRFHPKKIHVATRVFQALRLAVNDELRNLTVFLDQAAGVMKPDGRLCIISFHSLEDRLVKWHLRENQALNVLTRKPITPDETERQTNPRARSAKLRVAAAAA